MDRVRSYRLPPQVGQPSTTVSMMREVIISLIPTLGMAVFFFGLRVLVLTALSVGACVLFEYGYRRFMHLDNTVRDLSACVTGLLLALSLPPSAPYWVPVLGAAFSILLVKQFYGGLGKNFMNPALGGRMLLATFPLLINVAGQPTYFIPLQDNTLLVKSYAMVNVAQYQLVATGSTVAQCEQQYIRMLTDKGLTEEEEVPQTTAQGVVAEIRSAVLNGNTYYYVRLEEENVFYSLSAVENPTAVILNVGDQVTIEHEMAEDTTAILQGYSLTIDATAPASTPES